MYQLFANLHATPFHVILLKIWTSNPRQPVGNADGTIYPIANKRNNAQKSPGSILRLRFIVRLVIDVKSKYQKSSAFKKLLNSE